MKAEIFQPVGRDPRAWIPIFPLVWAFCLAQAMSATSLTQFYAADENKIRETPRYLKICRRSDPEVDNCIKSSLEKFMESVNSGSPELNLPDIDPVEIPSVEFQQGSGNVSIHVSVKDLVIRGFKKFKIMSVKSNLMENKLEISMDSPYVIMTGQFSAQGGVYTFPISGEGDLSLNMTDVSAVLILRLAIADDVPGLGFFSVEDSLMDLLPNDISAHFGDYIDGSNKIGTAFNYFFNRNAHEIFTIIKPKLSGVLADALGAIANEVLSRHPEDVLLPP